MIRFFLFALCAFFLLQSPAFAAESNAFNPYLQKTLPVSKSPSSDARKALHSIGAHASSLQQEAAYRPTWREELYPVVYGNPLAKGEILVLIDFSNPQSEVLWHNLLQTFPVLDPQQNKVVLYGKSGEYFGTDLLGFAIWIAKERKGQAIAFMSHALSRWNYVKAQQKAQGREQAFANEYDATLSDTEKPLHYAYMSRLHPVVPFKQELPVAKYSYVAGSINTNQALQVCDYYSIPSLPALVVNGKVLTEPSPKDILKALQ